MISRRRTISFIWVRHCLSGNKRAQSSQFCRLPYSKPYSGISSGRETSRSFFWLSCSQPASESNTTDWQRSSPWQRSSCVSSTSWKSCCEAIWRLQEVHTGLFRCCCCFDHSVYVRAGRRVVLASRCNFLYLFLCIGTLDERFDTANGAAYQSAQAVDLFHTSPSLGADCWR